MSTIEAGGRFMEQQSSSLQSFGRIILVAILVLSAVWILRRFLPALAWAGVLAVATWPVRQWLVRKGMMPSITAILLTLVVGILIIGPLIILAVQMAREAGGVIQIVRELSEAGLGTPEWVPQIPFVGIYVASWWQDHLADPDAAKELLGRAESLDILHWTRSLGSEAVSRLVTLAFTLLTLLFAYRDGPTIVEQSRIVADRLFGRSAERLGEEAIVAIRATVNGLVLVGLAEGSGTWRGLRAGRRASSYSVRIRHRAARNSSFRSAAHLRDRLLHSHHSVPHYSCRVAFLVRDSRGLRR